MTIRTAALDDELAPEVSYCIPVFNAESTLAPTLRSILAQDGSREILVVDNASTDRSREVAHGLLDGIAEARVVANPANLGRIANWNRCLELARGRFVKFLMASDVLWRGSTRRLVQAAEDGGAVLACSQHAWWDGRPEEPPAMLAAAAIRRIPAVEAMRQVAGGENPFWALNGLVIRREAAARLALRFREDLPYLADLEFCLRLASTGTMVFVETPSYWFNTGLRSRFHYRGAEPAAYFAQVRTVQAAAREALRAAGERPPDPGAGLLHSYRMALQQGLVRPSLSMLPRIFVDHRRHLGHAVVLWLAETTGLRRLAQGRRLWLSDRLPWLARWWRNRRSRRVGEPVR